MPEALSRKEALAMIDQQFLEDLCEQELGIVAGIRSGIGRLFQQVERCLGLDEAFIPHGNTEFPGGMTQQDMVFLRSVYQVPEGEIRLDSHTMGRPSDLQKILLEAIFQKIRAEGVNAWDTERGLSLLRVQELFCELVGELMGVHPDRVLWGPNATDLMRQILKALPGRLDIQKTFYDADHFSTVHKMMSDAKRIRALDFSTEGFEKKIPRDAQAVLISHAGYKTGRMWDLPALVSCLRAQSPGALILIDCYQTAGTVPIDIDALGSGVVGISGGHKQLNAGTGAAFAAFSSGTISWLHEHVKGWMAEARSGEAWNYADRPTQSLQAETTDELKGGTPDIYGMARMVAELSVLKKLGNGSVRKGVEKVRQKMLYQTELLQLQAKAARFQVISPETLDRNAMVLLRHPEVPSLRLQTQLKLQRIFCDVRPGSGSQNGFLRLSCNAYTTDDEIQEAMRVLEQIVIRHLSGKHVEKTEDRTGVER